MMEINYEYGKPLSRSYDSLDEMMDEFEQHRKEERRRNPIKYYAELVWYRVICKAWEAPGNWYKECKYFWQRGTRGWSDRDVWGIDYFLADIMPGMLDKLKATNHGMPQKLYQEAYEEITGKTNDYWYKGDDALETKICELGEKKFNTILDCIAWTFRTAKLIQDSEWHIPHKGTRMNDYRYLSRMEVVMFYKGFDLFKEYFFDLWD